MTITRRLLAGLLAILVAASVQGQVLKSSAGILLSGGKPVLGALVASATLIGDFADNSGTNVTSVGVHPTSATAAGDGIAVFVGCDSSTSITAVQDTQGNTYVSQGSQLIAGQGYLTVWVAAGAVHALTTADTISATIAVSSSYPNITVVDVKNASGTLLGHNSNQQTSFTSMTADAVTSNTIAAGAVPGLMLGFTINLSGTQPPTSGTGFAGAGIINFGGGGNNGFWESKHSASIGTAAATFTATTSSSDSYVTFGVAFADL